MLIPVIVAFVLSFHRWDMFSSPEFVGLKNYKLLLRDPWFQKSLMNTFFFVIVSVPMSMLISFFLAVFLNEKLRGVVIFRTIYFLPVVASLVAVALVWRWLYNPDFGLINIAGLSIINFFINLINSITSIFGISPISPVSGSINWLGNTFWAMPAVIIMSVWKTLGYNMVIYLVGLQGIPDVLYESAEVDGANWWKKLTSITVPMLQPTTFFVLVMSLIGAFQVFVEIYVMTEGGPGGATSTLVFYLYANAFKWFKMGYACSIAWILFALIFIITLFQWRYFRKGEELY